MWEVRIPCPLRACLVSWVRSASAFLARPYSTATRVPWLAENQTYVRYPRFPHKRAEGLGEALSQRGFSALCANRPRVITPEAVLQEGMWRQPFGCSEPCFMIRLSSWAHDAIPAAALGPAAPSGNRPGRLPLPLRHDGRLWQDASLPTSHPLKPCASDIPLRAPQGVLSGDSHQSKTRVAQSSGGCYTHKCQNHSSPTRGIADN